MANNKLYGIKYPFTNEGWRKSFVDTNDTEVDYVQSEILHIMFTPKGQRLRMPNFGTDLIKYLFEPNDSETWTKIKTDIREQISAYLPQVVFKDVNVYTDSKNGHSAIAEISYTIKHGTNEEEYKITVPVV